MLIFDFLYYNDNGDNMKILCVGHSAYDITTPLESFPKENTKNRVHERIECGGGPAGNAAYLLAKWGLDVYFAGIVGNDLYGKKIRDEFRTIGVNTDYLQLSDEHITTTSHIIANKANGSRTILTYRPSNMKMADVNIDINPDIILIDGQEYEMSKKLIKQYPDALTIIDAGRDRKEVKELCYMADYVVCSKEFCELVSGITIMDKTSLDAALNNLESEFNTNIIVTLEDEGCAYKNNGVVTIVPTIKVKAIDSTGAGDIFHGAFAYGIANNWPLEKTLKYANAAGAMSVTRIGGRNSIFSKEEMDEVFNEVK